MSKNPVGVLRGTFEDLHAAGCIQTGADRFETVSIAKSQFGPLFYGLMGATGNNPCDGCPAYKGGQCEAFKKHHSSMRRSTIRPVQVKPEKTVAQLAEELGISKSEVRRRKVQGVL